jgi:hypothetical protein
VGPSLDRTRFTDEHQDLAAAYADHAAVALQYATAQQPISNSTATTETPTPSAIAARRIASRSAGDNRLSPPSQQQARNAICISPTAKIRRAAPEDAIDSGTATPVSLRPAR